MVSCEEKIKEKKAGISQRVDATENNSEPVKKPLSEAFKKYWYAGEAEITSYELQQARYGELRDGKAVLIYVTEPFLAEKQVKADGNNPDNIPVLKLNSTKNYLTGIYPYSIMSSSFYPVHDDSHAIKVSFSAQEWCGHVYAQLNNRDKFSVQSHSYFENEADELMELDKATLENELWNKIRINPKALPVGTFEMIPSLEYIRLSHNTLKAYKAITTLTVNGEISTYEITYPELGRTLHIDFTTVFPFGIEGWTESFKSGFGNNAKMLTSTARKIRSIKSPYWTKNSNSYLSLRDSLGL
tara:strand:- start:2594 stop:3490 length:897 start_codon:yes stop_codon:yes gene_type:complete